jgi:hypothetical protein
MNLCWIVDKELGGHVRDVDTEERAALLGAGYKEFRLTCFTPNSTREGVLYDQGLTSAEELAQHVEKSGLALFGGCTRMEVHRPDSSLALRLPPGDLAAEMSEHLPYRAR